jgi:hypothetical protein
MSGRLILYESYSGDRQILFTAIFRDFPQSFNKIILWNLNAAHDLEPHYLKKAVYNEFSIKTVVVVFRPRRPEWNTLDLKVRRVRSCINVHSAWETAMESDIREINFIWQANRNPLHFGYRPLYSITRVYFTYSGCVLLGKSVTWETNANGDCLR